MNRITTKNSIGQNVLCSPIICGRCGEADWSPVMENGEPITDQIAALETQMNTITDELEMTKRERDSAVAQLHGICSACANYTSNHNEGPCRFCCHEIARDPKAEVNDNWRWNGGRK